MIFNSVSKYNWRRSSSHLIFSLQFLYDAPVVVVCFFQPGSPAREPPLFTAFMFLIMMLKGTGTRGPGTCTTAGARHGAWHQVPGREKRNCFAVPAALFLVQSRSSQSDRSEHHRPQELDLVLIPHNWYVNYNWTRTWLLDYGGFQIVRCEYGRPDEGRGRGLDRAMLL